MTAIELDKLLENIDSDYKVFIKLYTPKSYIKDLDSYISEKCDSIEVDKTNKIIYLKNKNS